MAGRPDGGDGGDAGGVGGAGGLFNGWLAGVLLDERLLDLLTSKIDLLLRFFMISFKFKTSWKIMQVLILVKFRLF